MGKRKDRGLIRSAFLSFAKLQFMETNRPCDTSVTTHSVTQNSVVSVTTNSVTQNSVVMSLQTL